MIARALTLSVLLLGGAASLALVSRPTPTVDREPLATLPLDLGNWAGQDAPRFDDQILAVLGADDYLNRVYVSPARAYVGLYVGYHGSQQEGDSVHSPLNCLPGAGWQPVRAGRLTIAIDPLLLPELTDAGDGPRTIEVNRYIIEKGLDRQLVLYWYQSQGHIVANEYMSKIYLILNALRRERTDVALVRVVTPIDQRDADSEEAAEGRAVDFVKATLPWLVRLLPA